MIVCYAGTPGSCKTLEAVKRVVANLRMGRRVYTNINGMGDDECKEAIRSLSGLEIDAFDDLFHHVEDEKLLRYWENCPDGSFIIIDEVHKLINNRNWDKPENKDFASNASTHRLHGYNILLITQDIGKVDSHVRSLIEWTYFYRKNNFFGSLIKKQFLRYTYTGDSHDGKPLASKTMVMDDRYYHCYKSYTKEAGGEVDFQSHVNILRHPVFFIIPVLLVLTAFLFFKKSTFAKGDVFGASKAVKQQPMMNGIAVKPHAQVQGVHSSASVRVPLPPPPVPPAPSPLPSFRNVSSVMLGMSQKPSGPAQFWTWTDRKGQTHMTNMKWKIPYSALKVREYTY